MNEKNVKLTEKYKAFFWTNNYLSPIQKGIQTTHCISEMYLKYIHDPNRLGKIIDWAKFSKTIIVFDGGSSEDLLRVTESKIFMNFINLPKSAFRESYGALNNAVTCVGILVPEYIYKEADRFRKNKWNLSHHSAHGLLNYFLELDSIGWLEEEKDLMILISKGRLAN